eukprot:Awhi_evm2s1693
MKVQVKNFPIFPRNSSNQNFSMPSTARRSPPSVQNTNHVLSSLSRTAQHTENQKAKINPVIDLKDEHKIPPQHTEDQQTKIDSIKELKDEQIIPTPHTEDDFVLSLSTKKKDVSRQLDFALLRLYILRFLNC